MVDILLYGKPRNLRGTAARANNYLGSYNELPSGKHPVTTKEDKSTLYVYPVIVVHDPLEIGGFEPGSKFSATEYREMKCRFAFTPGTILEVRGTLRIIRRRNGRQEARRFKPTSP